MDDTWKRCSSCKSPISYGALYYVCSVSTCNRARTALVFCSVRCWDAHLPTARHRSDAGAIEERAPTREQQQREQAARERGESPGRARKRVFVRGTGTAASVVGRVDVDVLVVASKVKQYIRDRAEMNTSGNAMEALTRHVVALCDEAIDRARAEGRRTVKDRDFPRIPDYRNS